MKYLTFGRRPGQWPNSFRTLSDHFAVPTGIGVGVGDWCAQSMLEQHLMCAEKKKITLTCNVDAYRSGWTIVEFLSHRFKYHTPTRWATRVADGWVQVNGVDVSPGHPVAKGDVVAYTIFHAEPGVDFRYDVVYEDDHLLAVSKSGNIPCHACGVYIRNTLIGTLKNIHGDELNLAHRLDRETSGLIVLTKNVQAARVMGKTFAVGEVSKLYTAVVHGRLIEENVEVDAPIGKTMEELTDRPDAELDSDLADDLPRYVPRRCVDFENGKPAVTRFEVVRYAGDCTVVQAIPLSGRTNQIRVHLSHIGHPIVGDRVYRRPGPPPAAPPINRQALHCSELRFAHPVTGESVDLRAELPEDMKRLVEDLARQ